MSDFLDTAQAHPDISSVFAQDDGASMIQMLLLYAPDAFIDYDAAQASFDSPEFLCLLELAKRQTQPEAESPHEAAAAGCRYSQILRKRRAAMTDTDAQRLLRELQAEAVSVFEYDAAVSGILADELPYYFAEEQSAGQIADRIQRRVQLYLEETRR